MCWDAKTSISAFIIGTLINFFLLIKYNTHIPIVILCLGYQWALFMQLVEYFIWSDIKCKTNKNKVATKFALFFNITQPIIIYLLFMIISKAQIIYKLFATILFLFYTCYTLYHVFKNLEKYECLNRLENCSNLNLKWWKDTSGIVYCISLFSIILLLLRPFNLAIFLVLYLIISVIISIKFYSCGQPSLWCFTFVPIILVLVLYISFFKINI